ncbi:MAG: HAD-IB family hydrolase, partial [Acidimicrobiales bacterium]
MADSNSPVVAAFDLDGTLTEGGSVYYWLCSIAGKGHVRRAVLGLLGPLIVGAIRSSRWADHAKERLLQELLADTNVADVTAASRNFATEHLAREGRADLIDRLHWHIEQGHDVVIVSASPQIYVDVMTELLGATGGLGTRLAVNPVGRLTGGYLGKNCRGTEKMRRLTEWIEERHYTTPPVIYAYGNSRGDRRMLSGATYPYDVGKLGWLGPLRQFPRLKGETSG